MAKRSSSRSVTPVPSYMLDVFKARLDKKPEAEAMFADLLQKETDRFIDIHLNKMLDGSDDLGLEIFKTMAKHEAISYLAEMHARFKHNHAIACEKVLKMLVGSK
jgi:hypothetical protein